MSLLEPLPGFDWSLVRWGGPDARRTLRCSYIACNADLEPTDDEDGVPLMLFAENGAAAEFCVDCQVTLWGFDPRDRGEDDVDA